MSFEKKYLQKFITPDNCKDFWQDRNRVDICKKQYSNIEETTIVSELIFLRKSGLSDSDKLKVVFWNLSKPKIF